MYIYGKNVAKETLNSNKKINIAYLIQNFSDSDILYSLQKSNIKIKYLNKREMDDKIDGLHQGIILEIEDYKYVDIDEFINNDNAIVLILDHLEDPHNLGAIIRTSEAAKIDGIIIPKDRGALVNGTVFKTSVGAVDYMKIAKVTNLVSTIKELKDNGFWIVGTDMNGDYYNSIDYSGKIGIVIGSEGKGMSELVKKTCDYIASIPMYGEINSLNASVSAGIIIYEAIKNRK